MLDVGPVPAGVHAVQVQAVGQPGGCSAGLLLSWAGTLSLTVSGVTSADAAIIAPGESGSVSTLAAGAAGLQAVYTLPADAPGLATLSAATYENVLIQGPPPIVPLPGAVAFADLLLLGAQPIDPCLVDFVPPNPIRLAYWDGAAWAPVLDGAGAPPPYVSATTRFSIALTATSAPPVTGLTGTVFAFVAGYGFAGFAPPVDGDALNVAKAGRAIPLNWRLYDLGNNPVVALAPASVAVTAVSIDCGALTAAKDAVEAYATGASGLRNLGNGSYQFNWATLKSYAGTCRRLRLDLGERNPDGTPLYRTADFSFTR